MSHIICVCCNDVRENNIDVVHIFASLALMSSHAQDCAFFGLPFDEGQKAEVWICNECGRAIIFDDGGNRVSRIMRPEKPRPISVCSPSAQIGYFYNDERFFDAVDKYITCEIDKDLQPDYEFFDEQYADGKPLLTPSIVRKMAFENKELTSGCCWWAALSETCLAVYDRRPDDNVIPARLWIRSSMDEAEANIS